MCETYVEILSSCFFVIENIFMLNRESRIIRLLISKTDFFIVMTMRPLYCSGQTQTVHTPSFTCAFRTIIPGHREHVGAQPKIEQGILMLVLRGVGNTSCYTCVPPKHTHTHRNSRLSCNKWTATVVLFQLEWLEQCRGGGTVGAATRCSPACLLSQTQTDRQGRLSLLLIYF